MMDFSTQIDNQSPSQLHSKHFLQASLIFVLILEFICLVTSIEPFDSLSSDWLEVLSSLHNSSHPYLCLQFPFLTCRNKFCILKGHMYPHGYLHTTTKFFEDIGSGSSSTIVDLRERETQQHQWCPQRFTPQGIPIQR